MAMALTRLSLWLWGGKEHEPTTPNDSPMNSSFDFGLGFREPGSVKFPPSSRRMPKRKWRSREERRVDKEFDVVLVPSDGGCFSGSESDDPDWSVGWMEPHAPDFVNDGETENSFAVIVPCYVKGCCSEKLENAKGDILGTIDGYSHESTKYVEEFLSSLQNN